MNPLRPPVQFYLHPRDQGWQYPLSDSGVIELRDLVTKQTAAVLPVPLVVQILTEFVTRAGLTAAFLAPLLPVRKPLPPDLPIRGLPPPRAVQEARRTARRRRKRRSRDRPPPCHVRPGKV